MNKLFVSALCFALPVLLSAGDEAGVRKRKLSDSEVDIGVVSVKRLKESDPECLVECIEVDAVKAFQWLLQTGGSDRLSGLKLFKPQDSPHKINILLPDIKKYFDVIKFTDTCKVPCNLIFWRYNGVGVEFQQIEGPLTSIAKIREKMQGRARVKDLNELLPNVDDAEHPVQIQKEICSVKELEGVDGLLKDSRRIFLSAEFSKVRPPEGKERLSTAFNCTLLKKRLFEALKVVKETQQFLISTPIKVLEFQQCLEEKLGYLETSWRPIE